MNIVFFTGAGISAESGLPTFRDIAGKSNIEGFENLLTLSTFYKDPYRSWKFIDKLVKECLTAKPNEAHELIAKIGAPVITQNIDRFHQRAGSTEVIELHGGIGSCRCICCDKVQSIVSICECGGYTKPDFIFYEEMLDEGKIKRARELAKSADLFVVIGTSGQVYPAADLPKYARKKGATVIEINPGVSTFSPYVISRRYKMGASEGMRKLIKDFNLT